MRLYIFIRFIFFFLLAVLPESPKKISKTDKKDQSEVKINGLKFGSSQELVEDSVDSTDAVDKALSPYVGHRCNAQTKALFDSIRHTPVPDNELIDEYMAASQRGVTWYNRNFQRNLVKLNTGHFSFEEIKHKLQKTISTLMFFLMPLFALFLWLLFRRSKLYYTEHLVFSIHIHCVVFLVLILYMLLSALFSVSLWWPFFITLVYGWLCARNVYGAGWVRTTSKVLSAGFLYSVSLLVVVIFGIVISFI
jgi:cation transport ATPase